MAMNGYNGYSGHNGYSGYEVKLKVFEGPLDLLLHLIEKNEVDIYDIPIAAIADQYLAYMRTLDQYDIEVASEFLVMAATLLYIKSRMLLPAPPAQEIPQETEDPRQELVERLVEYRRYKRMAEVFERLIRERQKYFARKPSLPERRWQLPMCLTAEELAAAFAAAWAAEEEDYSLISREEISVQEKIADILSLLRGRTRLELRQALIRSGSRTEFVAAFLAALELIRQRRVIAVQEEQFGPIYLVAKE